MTFAMKAHKKVQMNNFKCQLKVLSECTLGTLNCLYHNQAQKESQKPFITSVSMNQRINNSFKDTYITPQLILI